VRLDPLRDVRPPAIDADHLTAFAQHARSCDAGAGEADDQI